MDLTKKKPLIGLDIGTHAVKVARLLHDSEGYTVTALGYTPIQEQGRETDDLSEAKLAAVRETLARIELESLEHWVVCALNGEEVLVRPFELGPLQPNEIPQAIRLEAMQVSPFGMDKATVDHQVLNNNGNGKANSTKERPIKGVMAVGTHAAIISKSDLARQAGAKCVLMDIDGLALLNAAMYLSADNNAETDPQEAVAVINVGHAYTTVAIGVSDTAPFIRDISFAGNSVVELLCEQMNWPRKQALSALQKGHTHGADQGHIHAILDQACNQLADSIAETLRYYATQPTGRSLRQVRICGGAARMQGLLPHLQQRLSGYAITLWNPLETLTHTPEVQPDLDFDKLGPSFAIALGLALREL